MLNPSGYIKTEGHKKIHATTHKKATEKQCPEYLEEGMQCAEPSNRNKI